MIRPSASSVERQLACPGSAHLPQSEYHSDYADQGADRHEDAEIAALLGAVDDLPWQVRRLLQPGDVFATECAMAYDVSSDTARALGNINWRDYRDLRPFEIPMTIDLIIYGESRIIVVDYKGYEEVTTAAENPQLATGALAVARASGRDEIIVAIVYLGASWKPADVASLTVFDLDIHAASLRDMMTSSDRSLRIGPWCKYCPALIGPGGIQCPEQRALALRAGDGELAVRIEAMIPFSDDDEAAEAYDLLQRIKVVATRLKAALYARAHERPIPLRSGRMFGPVTKPGDREYDGATVHRVVTDQLGREVADHVVEMTSTQVRFKEVVSKLVPRGKFAATQRDVFGEVERLGGMTRKTSTAIEEYDNQLRLGDGDKPVKDEAP